MSPVSPTSQVLTWEFMFARTPQVQPVIPFRLLSGHARKKQKTIKTTGPNSALCFCLIYSGYLSSWHLQPRKKRSIWLTSHRNTVDSFTSTDTIALTLELVYCSSIFRYRLYLFPSPLPLHPLPAHEASNINHTWHGITFGKKVEVI